MENVWNFMKLQQTIEWLQKETVILFGFEMERSSPYQGDTNDMHCANHVDNISENN